MQTLTLTIAQTLLDEIHEQTAAEAPRECCGLLGGVRRESTYLARSRYPLHNQSAQPETQFFAAPEDLFPAMRQMRERGEDLVAIYHSHPRGPARPSETDLALAFYPEAFLIIVTLSPIPGLRAFRLSGNDAIEVEVVTEP
jgi:proteasome lid subunit RPN8/RPN11